MAQPGQAPITNGNCTVDASNSSLTTFPSDATSVQLNLMLTFNAAWQQQSKTDYLWVWDRDKNGAGWLSAGPYTIAGPATTITSSPAGVPITVTVAGTPITCTTPCSAFNWAPGTQVTLSAPSQLSGTGIQGQFSNWSDGGSQSHSITVGTFSATYTANYAAQYYLTTGVSGSGTVTPSSGWYAPGAQFTITETPNPGNQFLSFTGTTNTNSVSIPVTMNGPVTETAQFGVLYTFSGLQGPQSVAPGGIAVFTMQIAPAGYPGQLISNMQWSCTSNPYLNVSSAFSPPSVYSSSSGTMVSVETQIASNIALAGCSSLQFNMTLQIYGQSPSLSTTTFSPITLTVQTTNALSMWASLLSQTASTATYLVNGSANFGGTVTFAKQTGTCATVLGAPTMTVNGSPTQTRAAQATVSVSTTACSAGTNATLTLTGSGGGTGGTAIAPLQTAPAAAVMTNPPPGATIPLTTSFSWSAVSGATYCLYTGTAPQLTCSGSASSGASVTFPAPGQVYATLGTQVSGVWQYQQYSYTVNPNPSGQALILTSGPPTAVAPSSGREIQYVYHFTGGDATAVTGVTTNIGVTGRIVSVGQGTIVVAFKASPNQFTSTVTGEVTISGPSGQTDGGPVDGIQGPGFGSVSPSEFPIWQTADPPNIDLTVSDVDIAADGTVPWANLASNDGSYNSQGAGLSLTGSGDNVDGAASFPWPTVAGPYSFWLTGEICFDANCESWVWGDGPPTTITVDPAGGGTGGVTVSGTVYNPISSVGVPGVTITDSGGAPQATTRSDGTYTITANSASDTLTPSMTGYTFNPTSSQANGTPGVPVNFVATPTGLVPNITAISPQSVTEADANNSNIIYGIYGTNLVSSNGSGVVFVDANGNADPTITFTVTQQDDPLIQGTIALTSNVQPGNHNFYVASPNGNSNTLTFGVQGDLAPSINSVTTPSGTATLTEGQPVTVTVTGSNFGPACDGSGTPCQTAALNVCAVGATPPCSTNDISVTNINWSDTQITATFTANVSAGAYEVAVGSAGATGQGFFAAPAAKGKYSNTWQQIVVGGNPNLQLIVTSQTNGGTVYTLTAQGSNLCAYVDENYNMPKITAVVSSANGGPPPTGTAAWQLWVIYNYTTWSSPATMSGNRVSAFDTAYTTPESPAQAANNPYTFPGPSDGNVHVGGALITWGYSPDGIQPMQPQPTFMFNICGTNPDPTTFPTSTPATSAALAATNYWFAQKTALHESNMSEFCQQSSNRAISPPFCSQRANDGLPIWGTPSGYGMMQLDPAIQLKDVWNFQTNVSDWTTLTQKRPGPGNWAGEVKLFNLYNAQNPSAPAAAPLDVYYNDTAGNPSACHFTMPMVKGIGLSSAPPTGQSFADANIIKETNGVGVCWTTSGVPNAGSCPKDNTGHLLPGVNYGTIDYIIFNSKHLYKGDVPHWQVVTQESVSQDTVAGVCSCTGPPANCFPNQLPTSSPPSGCWPGVAGYDPQNPNSCPRPQQ